MKPVKYCVVDAFADSAFKGNPAAICLLEEERDDEWLQAVTCEFNLPITCFLTRLVTDTASDDSSTQPMFRLRWFGTCAGEVEICGHGTLAASYFIFAYGLVNTNTIEFSTLSGKLTAQRIPESIILDSTNIRKGKAREDFSIELNFPVIPLVEFNSDDTSQISKSLNGVSVLEIMKIAAADDIFVVLSSGKAVAELQPDFDEMVKCPGRGIIVTGTALSESGFDFVSRVFFPKLGLDEDLVCGSAHCSLAPYWSKKLEKCDFVAYQASRRSGVINLHLDEKNQRVLLRGKAVAVMEGFILV